jgi:CheY-like chemotaxis protein
VRSSGGGRTSDDRRPGKGGDAPAPRPAPLQRILVGLRVLVVDDDPDVLELFAAALTSCGADVTTTDNARDAVALATRLRPHAIVSDIAMVGEDARVLAAGFAEHLQKPIDPDALCRLVASVARR